MADWLARNIIITGCRFDVRRLKPGQYIAYQHNVEGEPESIHVTLDFDVPAPTTREAQAAVSAAVQSLADAFAAGHIDLNGECLIRIGHGKPGTVT